MPSDVQVDFRKLIPEVRQQILSRCERAPEKYDEIDIQNVGSIDWWCLRYIKWNRGDVDKSVQQLDDCLQWRRLFGVNTRSEADLPQEFVKAGGIFPFGCDSAGLQLIYMRVKVYKKVPKLMQYFRQFVVGVIEKVDRDSLEIGYALVFDLTGVGFSNADMDFLQFLINTLKNFYPYGLRYVVVHNLPRLLRPLWTIAKLWIGSQQRIIKFVSGDEIKAVIPVDQLPRYLGGESETDFTVAPEGCKSVQELAPKYGFTDTEVDGYMKMFEPHMIEAQKLVSVVK